MFTSAPPSSAKPGRRRSLIAAVASLLVLASASPAAAQDEAFPNAAPAPQVTSGPHSPDNDLAPRWSFSASDVATSFECSLARDDTPVGDWAPCASPVVYDLSSQPDGDYTFAVRALGADGGPSQVATTHYTLDTSVPALPTILSLPGPAASDRTPEWAFSGGDRFECRVDRGRDAVDDWAPCASPHSVDLSAEGDGAFTFSVRGVADDGARGPVRTDGYLLDTQAPAAPDISSTLPPVANARSATVAFSAESGAQVECRLTGDAVADPQWSPCTSPADFDLGGQPDGTYSLGLRATDAAGNASEQAVVDYTLDTTAPAAPAVDTPAVTPSTRLQPSFDFASDPDDTYECRLDGPGGYATGWQPCVAPAPYDLTGQPDGAYTFAVRGTDAAGNTGDSGIATYALERDPDAVDLRSGPGRTGRTRAPQWSFKASGGSGFVCSLGFESAVIFKAATCGSPRSYNLSGRPDGTYKFTVRASGNDGVTREPATQEYELDSTAPARPEVAAAPVSPARDDNPGWKFTGEDGAALDCRVARGQNTVVDWTSCTNPRSFDLGQTDGNYSVTVRARDAAGNVGPVETSAYQLDTTPPAAPALSAKPKDDDIDRSPTWSFTGESGVVFTCALLHESQVVVPKSSCAEAQTYNLSGAQPGTYTFAVRATDPAGNKSTIRTSTYKLAAAPARAATGSGSGGSGSAGGAGTAGGSDFTAGGAGGGSGSGAAAGGSPSSTGGTQQPRANSGSRTPTTADGTRTTSSRPGAGGTTGPASGAGGAARSTAGSTGRGNGSRAGGAGAKRDAAGGAGGSPRRRGLADAARDTVRDAGRGMARALTGDVAKRVFPISILVLLGAFLLVQSRIDRGDPKLALAPIDGDPDLEFEPPPTRR